MKTRIFLTAVCPAIISLLVFGCGQQNSAPVGHTLIPITGAFAWTFGKKLPAECEIKPSAGLGSKSGTFQFVDWGTNAFPFRGVLVSCLPDRTIYAIQADASAEYAGQVLRLLAARYGACETFNRGTAIESHRWTDGDRELTLTVSAISLAPILAVYQDNGILARYERQLHDAQERSAATSLATNL